MSAYFLKGTIQEYDWGGKKFIPNLLGITPEPDNTYAEYWMGSHTKGESELETTDGWKRLSDCIKNNSGALLGEKVNEAFQGQLPFLFKVLDVDKMLSIQVHPTIDQARKGFVRENEMGIPLHAPNRNYRDANHKPEVMVALTPFWLLHGFQSKEAVYSALLQHEELHALANECRALGIESFYKKVMESPQQEIDNWLSPLADKLLPFFESGQLSDKSSADYWAAKAMLERQPKEGRYDRGILSIYMLNLVSLSPGEGIYQKAGILHAYLGGVNVELMANSDNVFRGGLTSKHIDIPELLKTLDFSTVVPEILKGDTLASTWKQYPTPEPDFQLFSLQLEEGEHTDKVADGPEVLILMEGKLRLAPDKILDKGQCVFLSHGTDYRLEALEGCTLFRAGTNVT